MVAGGEHRGGQEGGIINERSLDKVIVDPMSATARNGPTTGGQALPLHLLCLACDLAFLPASHSAFFPNLLPFCSSEWQSMACIRTTSPLVDCRAPLAMTRVGFENDQGGFEKRIGTFFNPSLFCHNTRRSCDGPAPRPGKDDTPGRRGRQKPVHGTGMLERCRIARFINPAIMGGGRFSMMVFSKSHSCISGYSFPLFHPRRAGTRAGHKRRRRVSAWLPFPDNHGFAPTDDAAACFLPISFSTSMAR